MKTKKGQAIAKKKKNTINLDNEIIIGLNTKPEKEKNGKNKNKKVKKIKEKNIKAKKINKRKNNKQKKGYTKVVKIVIILILIITAIILFLLSDLFNVKKINVTGNSKISTDEIIRLSTIKTEENMFKINLAKVKRSIKQNPYINTVKIRRKLNGIVELEIEERVATYMLTFENGCIYINNQGYILEISQEPIAAPMIIGFETDLLIKKTGERLENEDLNKLEKVILITQLAEKREIKDKITYINVSNIKDIEIYMDSEKKLIHFGDEQNAGKKIDRLKVVLEQEKESEGEIFIENIENIYFREKV